MIDILFHPKSKRKWWRWEGGVVKFLISPVNQSLPLSNNVDKSSRHWEDKIRKPWPYLF